MTRPPCRFFLFKLGGCGRSQDCPFDHTIRPQHLSKELNAAEAEKLLKILNEQNRANCKHYYSSTCEDKKCKFPHLLKQSFLRADITSSIGFRGKASKKTPATPKKSEPTTQGSKSLRTVAAPLEALVPLPVHWMHLDYVHHPFQPLPVWQGPIY